MRFLDAVVRCPIHLVELPYHPAFVGLLGREGVYEAFGFGFWEKSRQLLVTRHP